MSSWEAIRLIARREIVTRVRTRAFRIALAIAVAAVVAAIVLPDVLDRPERAYVVHVDEALTAPEVEALRLAGVAVGREVDIQPLVDEESSRTEIAAGDVDLAVVDGTLVVRRAPSATDTSTFARFLSAAGSSLRVFAGLYDQGLSPEDARTALGHAPLEVEGVLPPRDERTAQKAITMIGIVAIFVFVQQYGTWVVNGVVEEKSSRVIEVLLSVVRPSELLIGKTVGIGIVALLHGSAIAVAALLATAATGGSLLDAGAPGLIVSMLGWFILAYVLYCLLMAMAGSLVARQEDAQNVAFPVLAPLIAGYVISVSTVWAPEPPPVLTVLSFLPLTAPVAMPTRMAFGPVPAGEVAVAIALLLGTTVLVARLAGVVYGRGVMHTSGRLRLRDVLRGDVGA